ncbi:uncharacterized protein LOC124194243 [Daphnia pulex]|uniref:uncharacterized protein LOC124194243 n=1 Tax=Daphnia pulex TaxID=6669 RepID=UPI001EDF0B7C|nr:uncharacterized protein LOC124194243 [Daphnia pulex]
MSTRSRSVGKSLQLTFKQQGSMRDRCVHKFKGRDENLKLNKTDEMENNLEDPTSRVSEPKCKREGRKRRVDLKCFQPTDWLSSIKPCKSPFYPQVGDEVMYFKQGHEMYVAAVQQKNLYEINPDLLPWTKQIIRQQEWVKIIGIEFEIKPPRLVCLKLGIIDPVSGLLTRKCFSIEYHDMDDIPDFLVLKQDYDKAVKRPWKRLQQFRSLMNDDCGVQMWWEGQFIKSEPLDAKFPESMFLCYCVRWDNGDREPLSPWELENIDPGRRPCRTGASVNLLPIEICSSLYTPQTCDWPPLGDRDFECDRISKGISQVMSLYEAKHFCAPVNLELFPAYAFTVKYPMDLSTIKARLEHRFYRRAAAVEYDVLRIRTNALIFNDPEKSDIVINSSIISDLCLEIIRNSDLDISTFYRELLEKYKVHGIKVKGSVVKLPVAKHQIEHSTSFALTFTNVVTGSSRSSTSKQKLVINPTQGSSSFVSSNHASVKLSSSLTVEPIVDNLTTDNSLSLTHQNSRNSETANTSRMIKKVTSPIGVEVEQSFKRRKTTSLIAPTAISSDEQFSGTTIQECDTSLSTYVNQNAPVTTKNILKRKSVTKENLDPTCTTVSSLPRVGSDGTLAVNTTEHVNSHDCSSMGICEESSVLSQNEIFSPMNNHLNFTRILPAEKNPRLFIPNKTPVSVPITPFPTPIPIAISTPVQVCPETSSLSTNILLKKADKYASKSLLSKNLFGSEKRINSRKLKSGGWSVSLHDFPSKKACTLVEDKSPQSCLPQQVLLFERDEMESCFSSNTLHQCPEAKTISAPSVTQEISTPDAKAMIDSYPTVSAFLNLDTKSKQREDHTQVEDPRASFAIPSIQSPPTFPSTDELIEKILADAKRPILKEKASKKSEKKKKVKSKSSVIPRLSKTNNDCLEPLQAKSKHKKIHARVEYLPALNAIPVNTKSKQREDHTQAEDPRPSFAIPSIQSPPTFPSTDELIEKILAKAKRPILKEKASKKSEKKKKVKSKSSIIPRLSKTNNDCLEPLQAKSKHKKIHARVEYLPALNAIPVEENQNQSVQNEVTLTPTNFVDGDSYEKGRTTSTPKELPALECQVVVSTNKTISKEKKHRSSEATCHNQQSVFSEESELTSSESVDALIEKILAESKRGILKQKTSRNKSEKKKESKVRAMPISRLLMLDKDCKEPPKRKSKHGRNCTRVTDHSAFNEEGGSIFIQSDDAIIQEILAEAKSSVLKKKTSKRRTSDISRSSSKDCHQNGSKYLGF